METVSLAFLESSIMVAEFNVDVAFVLLSKEEVDELLFSFH